MRHGLTLVGLDSHPGAWSNIFKLQSDFPALTLIVRTPSFAKVAHSVDMFLVLRMRHAWAPWLIRPTGTSLIATRV